MASALVLLAVLSWCGFASLWNSERTPADRSEPSEAAEQSRSVEREELAGVVAAATRSARTDGQRRRTSSVSAQHDLPVDAGTRSATAESKRPVRRSTPSGSLDEGADSSFRKPLLATRARSAAAAAKKKKPPHPPLDAPLSELKAFFEPDLTETPFNATVLIATPLRNARNHLGHFVQLLRSLSYPHRYVSVAFGEDSSTDGTYEYSFTLLPNLSDFRRVAIFSVHDFVSQGTDWAAVHEEKHQLARRSHLAEARNKLLELALQDEQYVLWVDSDVGSWRPDVVQHLLDAAVDVVAPACMYWTADGSPDVYDRNTWRETAESLALQRRLPESQLVLEGYGGAGSDDAYSERRPRRLYLTDLRAERRRLVEVDGVGGCVLLVWSELHRRGITFPNHVYKHHIETEGFAKLAKSKGYQPYGMPFLEVYHL